MIHLKFQRVLLFNIHLKVIYRNFLFFSRNQLSIIPSFISQLQALEVLIASHNRLVSLPEELGVLDKLMELVSIFCSHNLRGHNGLWILSCKEAIHLANKMLVVLLRYLLVTE